MRGDESSDFPLLPSLRNCGEGGVAVGDVCDMVSAVVKTRSAWVKFGSLRALRHF